ncbi:MAG: tetraacyldisaccharide 4'-kinase [Chromatiales bacterium]|nr:tetraacyldisaccharide 4'-kinase [Chromatiales bacterium]
MSTIDRLWYGPSAPLWPLAPLSWLYRGAGALRALAYRIGLRRIYRPPVPSIIVGNITVGGTGKTPLVIWLARHLVERGLRPGVLCRGYRGRAASWPQRVSAAGDPREVGDEAVLLAGGGDYPVAAGPDRGAAARDLVERAAVDVLVCDDGLQYPGLARDLEIVVVSGRRGFGNGWILPVGPLREPRSRADRAAVLAWNGTPPAGAGGFVLVPREFVNVDSGERLATAAFAGQRVHAVAGIGDPARFFTTLRELGCEPVEHAFPDHHRFTAADLSFGDGLPVLMTGKDAIKCRGLAPVPAWYLAVDAEPDEKLRVAIDHHLERLLHG